MEKLQKGRQGEMKQEGYNRSTKIKPSWSDLPIDLLGEIRKQLGFANQVRSGAICKNWTLSYKNYEKQLAHKLPGLLTCSSVQKFNSGLCSCVPKFNSLFESSCQLYDPFNGKPVEDYAVEEIFGKDVKLNEWRLTSKFGWILFSREKKRKPVNFTEFFLFSVFTKKIISLPDLELIKPTTITTFSSDPNSPNCIFIVLHESKSDNISISTFSLQNEDRKWITTKFKRKIRYSIKNVVYIQGTLYCISELSNLAAYRVSSREWNVLENSFYMISELNGNYDSRLLEMDGDLLLVKLDKNDFKPCTILRFDFSVNHWVRQRRFRDRALFIGRNGLFSVPVVDWTRRIILGNRVYYLGHEGGCKVYSFKKGKLVYCEEGSKFNGWNVNAFGAEYIWIEPRDHLVNHN